jgi:hypothetical protein
MGRRRYGGRSPGDCDQYWRSRNNEWRTGYSKRNSDCGKARWSGNDSSCCRNAGNHPRCLGNIADVLRNFVVTLSKTAQLISN